MTFFRPEFFNRIDAVINFDPLSPETMRQITEKELRDLASREGLTRAGLRLTWTDRLLDWLTQRGFDHRYGARPLQRAIETIVVAPLAHYRIDRDASESLVIEGSSRVDGSSP